jgi:hypothetical protein
MQVSARSPTDQRIADTVRVAPYLTHVIRPQGQLALMPQDNSTHPRKPKREKRPKQERQPRTHEEPHFNVGAPRTPRRGQPGSPGGRPRTNRRPDVSDAGTRAFFLWLGVAIEAAFLVLPGSIPDYPPPSFDEAIAAAAAARSAPPLSPADSTTTHSSSSPDRRQPVPILIPPLPRTHNQPVVSRTLPDSEASESVRYSTQAEYDSGSDDGDLEVISTSEATTPTTPSEQDSPRRPTRGATPEFGTTSSSARTVRSSRSQLTLTPHLSDTSQDGGDDRSVSSPSTDSQAGDPVGARNLTPSPVPPKRRLHLLSGLLKSRDNHPASAPPTPTHPGASQLSLPLHFLSHPGSPSKPHRGESLIARKLFGHKGKDRAIDAEIERSSEPLETWDMLSDVERDVPASSTSGYSTPVASSAPEHFPGSPGPSDSATSPDARRGSARSKHRSLLNYRVLPSPLPLGPTVQRYPLNTGMDAERREPVVLPSAQQQSMASVVPATSLSTPAAPIHLLPPEKLPTQSVHALLKPPVVGDESTRGRALRATSSMIWTPGRPVPSPTRSATAPTSPSMTMSLSSASNADCDVDTPAITVVHDDQGGTLNTLPSSLVQEEEEEQFVTPPGSPARSLAALPLATINSRHPSPVRHEGRPGVTLRDDGPVPVGSPTRSEPHTRATRTLTITPRPSVGALHSFAPSHPSPLSNQSFERQALIPPAASPTTENLTTPKRDTVVSIGDTESLIELYVHSTVPTVPAAGPVTHATAATGDSDQRTPATSAEPGQHHYPGRPLPHPPGASQSGPVQPVLLDLFLAGNVPAGLPPYVEVEPGKQRSASALSSQSKQFSRAVCTTPSPLINQPGGYIPPPLPPPALLAVLNDDASEPSSPGSTYEMSLPSSPAMQREFTSLEALETPRDDEVNATITGSNREARHLSYALAPYCIADPRTSAMTEHAFGTGSHEPCTLGPDNDDHSNCDNDDDGACCRGAVQREWGAAGPRPGDAPAGHAQRACEAQVGATWCDRGPVRDMHDAIPRP